MTRPLFCQKVSRLGRCFPFSIKIMLSFHSSLAFINFQSSMFKILMFNDLHVFLPFQFGPQCQDIPQQIDHQHIQSPHLKFACNDLHCCLKYLIGRLNYVQA